MHAQGTYVCMEGPALSTRAESLLHRAWGADLIGMTAMPEAKLAREAELHYALVALPTDYDCWQLPAPGQTPESIVAGVVKNLRAVVAERARAHPPRAAAGGRQRRGAARCGCGSALAWASGPTAAASRPRCARGSPRCWAATSPWSRRVCDRRTEAAGPARAALTGRAGRGGEAAPHAGLGRRGPRMV